MSQSAPTAWVRFLKLTPPEKTDFFICLALLPLMHLAIRVRGIRGVKQYLQVSARDMLGGNAADEEEKLVEARRTAAMIQAASRWGIVRGNCLSQSLALCYLLRRRGVPALLRIGGKKDENAFEAHAWVELGGVALNDSNEVRREFSFFEQPTKQIPERK